LLYFQPHCQHLLLYLGTLLHHCQVWTSAWISQPILFPSRPPLISPLFYHPHNSIPWYLLRPRQQKTVNISSVFTSSPLVQLHG
jgi:hypothetical protein